METLTQTGVHLNGRNPEGMTRDTRAEMVSPDQASCWLERYPFPHQRKLREWHVQELMGALQRGEFEPGLISFHYVDGTPMLTDGQHRLSAIARSGIGTVLDVARVYNATLEEAEAAYRRIDQGNKRSPGETIAGSGLVEETGLSLFSLNLIGAAALLIHQGFGVGGRNVAERIEARNMDLRLELTRHWLDIGTDYLNLLKGGEKEVAKRMITKGCMAVGMVTLRDCPEKAEAFWNTVAQNDGLARNTPEYILARLLSANITTNRGSSSSYAAILSRQVAACWNDHFDGKNRTFVRKLDPTQPIRIKGVKLKSAAE